MSASVKIAVAFVTIRIAAVIFAPCGMSCILIEIFVRHEMMLPANHAAEAGEIAFNPIGVLAVLVGIGFRMVDAARLELQVQHIPMRGFIGEHGCVGSNQIADNLDAFGFAMADECQSAARALTQGYHNAAKA